MSDGLRVAVVGATGAVGSTMLELLGEMLRLVGVFERLAADARVDVRIHLGRLQQQPRPEAAHVAVGEG